MDLYGHLRNQQLLFICVKISYFSPHYIYLMDLTNHSRTAGSDLLLLMKLRWKHQILLQHSADSDLPDSSRFINTHLSVLPLSWQLRTGQLKQHQHLLWQFCFYSFRCLKRTLFAHFRQLWLKSCFLAFFRTIYFINKPVYHTSCSSLEATIEIFRLVKRPWCVKSEKSQSWCL